MRTVVTTSMEINEKEVTIDGYVHYHIDQRYGEDADGNRGESRTIVDDVVDIKAYDEDMDDISLTLDESQRAVEILTRKFMEE